MSVDIGRIRIRIGFAAAAFLACVLNCGDPGIFFIGIFSAILHELTHLSLMALFGCRFPAVEIVPGGVRIMAPEFEGLNYRRSFVCLVSAPLVNLLAGIVLYCVGTAVPSDFIRKLSLANLVLGGINLLPMSFLDGGRALENRLLCRDPSRTVDRIMLASDTACLVLFAVVLLVLSLRRYFSVPFTAFFFYCLISVLTMRKKRD